MNEFFTTLLNMSFVSSLLILAVILVRFAFKKAPKALLCILWALVGLRLICPFTFESRLSLVPDTDPVTKITEQAENSQGISEFETIDKDTVAYKTQTGSVVVTQKENVEIDYLALALKSVPYVWAGGVGVMGVLSVISYIRLRKSMVVCLHKEGNIYRCDGIKSPFILGVIRPKIYLPSHLKEDEQRVVVAHEKAHIRRLDHIWKPLGYLVLSVHWFNPLVWLAYALLCRDIEGACDEYVIRKMSTEEKKFYSFTLLSCSAPRHLLTACPVAFGEVSVKSRVENVLSYKKPALWIIISALLVISLVAVFFMTDPVKKKPEGFETPEELIHQVILEQEESNFSSQYFVCEAHEILLTEETRSTYTTYYMWVCSGAFAEKDNELEEDSYGLYPAAITVKQMSDNSYTLEEFWIPRDGDLYATDIKEKFPTELHNRVFNGTTQDSLSDEVEKKALEHFSIEAKPLKPEVGEYPRFSGEIIAVTDEHYLVKPFEYEVIMGESYEKIYVSKCDTDFLEGDIINVNYLPHIEDSDPPYISTEFVSLREKVFDRIEAYDLDLYRVYTQNSQQDVAYITAYEENTDNIEVYRYSPETYMPPENISEGSSHSYPYNFSPYLVLDYSTGYANFAYTDSFCIVGFFELEDNRLKINGIEENRRHFFIEDPDGKEFFFDLTDKGFVFDKEASAFIDDFPYSTDGKNYDVYLSHEAVFEGPWQLSVK